MNNPDIQPSEQPPQTLQTLQTLQPLQPPQNHQNPQKSKNPKKHKSHYKQLKLRKPYGLHEPQNSDENTTPGTSSVSKNKKHKSNCRFCHEKATCLTCHNIIKCREITDCEMCGAEYGRPKSEPISTGCLIVDCTRGDPAVWLVIERNQNGKNKMTMNDPGGKFDADKDRNHMQTLFREIKEELGFIICPNGKEPYVELGYTGKIYRCYILIHRVNSMKYMETAITPEHPIVRIRVKELLESEALEYRLRKLLTLKMQNCQMDGTLSEFLAGIIC